MYSLYFYTIELTSGHIKDYKIETFSREMADAILLTIIKKETGHETEVLR